MVKKNSVNGQRPGSRHVDRHSISFKGDLYERIRKSAEKNGRPISWEAARLIVERLEQEGSSQVA